MVFFLMLQLSLDLYYTEDEIYELSYTKEPKNPKIQVSGAAGAEFRVTACCNFSQQREGHLCDLCGCHIFKTNTAAMHPSKPHQSAAR